MSIRKTYRMLQQYYNGFSLLPIPSIQKHNYFFYKAYTSDKQLYRLFDTVLNKEVLDNHYIVTIRKAITNSSVPLTQAMTTDLDATRDTISLFFNESQFDTQEQAYVERTLRILHRALGNFREIEHKLTGDLSNLLSGHEFTGTYKINSDHIDNILDVLHQVYKGIQRMMKRLADFGDDLLHSEMDHLAGQEAQTSVNNLVQGLERWCRIHKTIIFQLQEWRAVRAAHERQEVLN